jgi:predicted PurR-regulated permease PerM
LAYWLRKELLLTFMALILAVLLDAVATLGTRFLKMRQGLAVVLAAVLLVAATGTALTLIAIPIVQQGTEFVQNLPKKIATFDRTVAQYRERFPWIERFWPATEAPAQPNGKAPQLAKKALVTASAALEDAATALAVFFLALFLAIDPNRWLRGVAQLWPGPGVEDRIALIRRIGSGLRSYLVMMGLYIVVMGAAWALGLWLIGIDYPLLFGAIGGLAEIVPYLGPMIGLIPPLLIAFSAGMTKILSVLGLYIVLHILEGYVLVPLLMAKSEHLPAPMVVLSILVCGTLFGTLGVVLALPLATAVYVIANETIYAGRAEQNTTPVTSRLDQSRPGASRPDQA